MQTLGLKNLIYPGIVKAGTYLSLVLLIAQGRYFSLSIIVITLLLFIVWLHLCSTDNRIAKIIKKGRNFTKDPIKFIIIYSLVMVAIFLQSKEYIFSYELHF